MHPSISQAIDQVLSENFLRVNPVSAYSSDNFDLNKKVRSSNSPEKKDDPLGKEFEEKLAIAIEKSNSKPSNQVKKY